MSSLAYRRIKDLEGQFPIPTPHAIFRVGTFDAANGHFIFDPHVQSHEVTVPGGIGKPLRVTFHLLPVNSVNIALQFSIINRRDDFGVTLFDGTTATAPQNQNTITIEIGKGDTADFTVTSGSRSFSSDLTLTRQIIGAGAFTIPALPITIVYAPPQGILRTNTVSYDAITSVGTTTELSFNSQQSTTTSDFNNLGDFRQKVHQILTDFNNPVTGAVAAGLSFLSDLIGSVQTTTVSGTSVTDDHSLEILDTREYVNGSESGEGPPDGNRIICLINVEIVWLVVNGGVTLSVLSTPERAAFPVRELLDDLQRPYPGTVTQLDHDTIRSLLRLDPFVSFSPIGNFRPRLIPPRFTPADQPNVFVGSGTGPGGDVVTFSHTVVITDLRTEVSFSGTIVDQSAGWLSFLGIGPSDSKTVVNTFTNSSARQRTQGETISVSITFNTQGDEQYGVTAFYDTIFETMAFTGFPTVNPTQI
jgi:hypothetical protein